MENQLKFYEVSSLWKRDKKPYVKQSSYVLYCLLLDKHLIPFFGECNLIDEALVQSFVLEKLSCGLSHKTVKDLVVLLKMVIRYGGRQKIFPFYDFDVKFPLLETKKEIEVLRISEQRKLRRYLQSNFSFVNFGILLCFGTGIRIGELCGLQWKDYIDDTGCISISKTVQRLRTEEGTSVLLVSSPKTLSSYREVPLSVELKRMTKSISRYMNPDYFILSNGPTPMEPRACRDHFKAILSYLELPPVKFHCLRHTFATRLVESGGDIKTISVMLGHSTVSTTLNLYVHPNIEQKRKCIEKMEKMLRI